MAERLFTDGTPARAIFSFGGGVQSHAVLALAAAGKLHYDAFVFANVGADSENPDTLAYIENVTKPYCEAHGLPFVEVAKRNRAGELVTLRADAMRQDKTSFPIPAFAGTGGQVMRSCTHDWKIRIVDRWIRAQGWPHVVIGLGISTDEWQRAKDGQWQDRENMEKAGHRFGFWKRREFPLIDLRISRNDCHRLIAETGLPLVPKSSCYFCPFQKMDEWKRMRAQRPDLFEQAAELEAAINTRGKDEYYSLTPTGKPLRDAVGDQAMLWPADDSCDSGYCFT